MSSFAALVLKRATARWSTRTDLVSGVAGVIVPCAYAAVGKAMPDNAALLIPETVAGFIFAVVLGRLITAPYFIWKEDQKKIAELQAELAGPERARRNRFLDAQESMRMDLAQQIARYTDGTQAAFLTHHYTEEIRERLESIACLFKHDAMFDSIWERFIDSLDKGKSIARISLDRDDPDGFIEEQKGRNFDYYFKMRTITGREIVSFLTYDEISWTECKKKMNDLHNRHADQGRVPFHDDASLDEVLSHRLQSGHEQEKPQ